MKRILTNFVLALSLVCGLNYTAHPDRRSFRDLVLSSSAAPPLSPTAVVPSADGKQLYVACETANELSVYDIVQRELVHQIEMPAPPSGLALSRDGRTLYVTCAGYKSRICAVSTSSWKITSRFVSGHTAIAPALSADGKFLYVCRRFNDSVQVLDSSTGKSVAQIPVEREPVASALSQDGKLLFVANHIHTGQSDTGVVAASVSVIDTAQRKLRKNIPLTNGSTLLRGLALSPDGKYLGVTHTLARFHLPATTVAHGWMNNNVLSLIDVDKLELLATVPLDEDERGAGNPWALQWKADGKVLAVTHAGTHELSLIDAPGLIAKILALPERPDRAFNAEPAYGQQAHARSDIPNDLSFLDGLRTRVKLNGKGPRCLAFVADKIYIAHYFSDSFSILDLSCGTRHSATIQMHSPIEIASARKGEMYFNDATLCYQGWQSCASCHSTDGRVDGMNWDLMNDGMGNPKNVKSLLYSFQTPPVMSLGVRGDAAGAIRAGLRSVLFSTPREQVAGAIDEFVKDLKPLPSPFLVHFRLSTPAERGKKLFFSKSIGCAQCHVPPLFTDLKPHAVGFGKFDQDTDQFYTPSLIESWRTAPYLHDGSAATLRDVVLTHGLKPRAKTKLMLDDTQIDELVAFVRSL